MTETVLGMDLGTTNTCVAVARGGKAQVIPSREGYNVIPSVTALTDEGGWIAGAMARRQAATNVERTIVSAKRFIGRRAGGRELKELADLYRYDVVAVRGGGLGIRCDGTIFSISEISAELLKEARSQAEDYLGEKIAKCVITVPAYFGDHQRQATRRAGTLAGLDVLRIVNEPTAAALAYGLGRGENKRVLVYDFGGGTFDVTILESKGGKFRVLATHGDTMLGGDDLDRRTVNHLAKGFLGKNPGAPDPRDDAMGLFRLREAAEKAKVELSGRLDTLVNLPFIVTASGTPLHLEATLRRAVFEGMAKDLLERTMTIVEATIEEAKLDRGSVDEILLVGGMTRMPKIQEMISSYLGKPPSKGVHPDEVVACGAAILGESLAESRADDFIDVTPHSLGITLSKDRFGVLIPKNTAVPAEAMKPFSTSRDGQNRIKIHVRQGTSEKASENELLGKFNIPLDGAPKKGEPKIEVSFKIDRDGIVDVSAKDVAAGREKSIRIAPEIDMDEIVEKIEARPAAARTALEPKELTAGRKMLKNMENTMEQFGRYMDDAFREKVDRLVSDLKEALAEKSVLGASMITAELETLSGEVYAKIRGVVK